MAVGAVVPGAARGSSADAGTPGIPQLMSGSAKQLRVTIRHHSRLPTVAESFVSFGFKVQSKGILKKTAGMLKINQALTSVASVSSVKQHGAKSIDRMDRGLNRLTGRRGRVGGGRDSLK